MYKGEGKKNFLFFSPNGQYNVKKKKKHLTYLQIFMSTYISNWFLQQKNFQVFVFVFVSAAAAATFFFFFIIPKRFNGLHAVENGD